MTNANVEPNPNPEPEPELESDEKAREERSLPSRAHICKLVQSYFQRYGLVRHQIESYNHFLATGLPHILDEYSEQSLTYNGIKHVVKFGKPSLRKPSVKEKDGCVRDIYPLEARLRGLSYMVDVLLPVRHQIFRSGGLSNPDDLNSSPLFELIDSRTYREIKLCQLPAMVYSNACWMPLRRSQACTLDMGGYFIIKGNEKVLLAQENVRTNVPITRLEKPDSNYSHLLEFRAWHESKERSTSNLTLRLLRTNQGQRMRIDVSVPFLTCVMPVPVTFRLLGIHTLEEMLPYVCLSNSATDPKIAHKLNTLARVVLYNDLAELSEHETYAWLGENGTAEKTPEKAIRAVEHIVHNEVLPHVGLARTDEVRTQKAVVLGRAVWKLLMLSMGAAKTDIRDHFSFRRLRFAGPIMALQLRQVVRNFMRVLKSHMHKALQNGKFINVVEAIKSKKITGAFKYAFATGQFGTQRNATKEKGVSQQLENGNLIARLSHLRRVNLPITRDGRSAAPRLLQDSQWATLCPCESPEGKPCGLVKNLAMLAHGRIGCPTRPVAMITRASKLLDTSTEACLDPAKTLVLVNGIPMGGTSQPENLTRDLRRLRNKMIIPFDTSVAWVKHEREIRVGTEPGCILWPVFNITHIHKFADVFEQYSSSPHHMWLGMMKHGVIEYMSKEAAGAYTIAATQKQFLESPKGTFSHMEISAEFILGVTAGTIPWADHNQSPRNIYQCLHEAEPVRMADNSLKAIKDVKVGDLVLTFDPDSLVVMPTAVVAHKVMPTVKPLVQVTTVTGRQIVVTSDHRFMTNQGWRCSDEFGAATKLAVYPELGVSSSAAIDRVLALVAVQSVVAVPNPDGRLLVADITTASSTHCFIGGRGAFGVHNSAMLKQAKSIPMLNFLQRMDTALHILCYPQRSLCSTMPSRMIGLDEMPAGMQCIVAVLPMRGGNQEDSIIINQASLDLGLFRAYYLRTYKDRADSKGPDTYRFEKPDAKKTKGMKNASYEKLDDHDGLVGPGTRVDPGDVLIGKVMETKQVRKNKGSLIRDQSVCLKGDEQAIVDKVLLSNTPDGKRTVKIRTRVMRTPELGDKFASMSAQKGVLGMIVSKEDMPFTKDGITPDIVINPHAFPSRMTIGQLIEMIAGKVAALTGKIQDATPFQGLDLEKELADELHRVGYSRYGKETMYSGTTGEPLEVQVYIGPCYYQALKHHVVDKCNARSEGPLTVCHRQPVEGRNKNGGLRLGEMERDALLTHGVMGIAANRLGKMSDPYEVGVCSKCGLQAERATPTSEAFSQQTDGVYGARPYCRLCRSSRHVQLVKMPYAWKLFEQYMMGCNIGMHKRLTNDDENLSINQD